MVRFGAFEFDAVTRRLRRDGMDVHLPPKAFELLTVLVEAAPRVVSKRELHTKLWPGGAVTDATLVALVKQLRRSMSDRDHPTPLIRTVHRVGYALETQPRRERAMPGTPERWLMAGQRRLPLIAGENIVGRDTAAQVRLDDPMISRRHARIAVTAGATQMEDLGSKNGTFLDGQPVKEAPVLLCDGARLAFGTLQVIYRESGGGMPTLTHFKED